MYDHIAPDAFNDPSICGIAVSDSEPEGLSRELIASEFHGEIKETCILRIRKRSAVLLKLFM